MLLPAQGGYHCVRLFTAFLTTLLVPEGAVGTWENQRGESWYHVVLVQELSGLSVMRCRSPQMTGPNRHPLHPATAKGGQPQPDAFLTDEYQRTLATR